jgi:mono/diheme cytochrome c family protein
MCVEPGTDLVLLHPDGVIETLVKAGAAQAVADPCVSFDAAWVFYALFDGIERHPSGLAYAASADLYKVNVATRERVRLTHQEYTPNLGVVDPEHRARPVLNLGPCEVPGGWLVFTSDRNGFVPPRTYPRLRTRGDDSPDLTTLQLMRMRSDGKDVETIGHLNVNTAMHPTVLRDGRVMFGSFENSGLRDIRSWAIWTIHPDGTHWQSLLPALSAPTAVARHLTTQLSDGRIVCEQYYFHNTLGFGTFFSFDAHAPEGEPYFGSAGSEDPRNLDLSPKLHAITGRMAFTPHGATELTRFASAGTSAAYLSDPDDESSPRVGKVGQPAAAPDGHLLAAYSPGPVFGFSKGDLRKGFVAPAAHSGIYLLPHGAPIDAPSQMRCIKVDPEHNLAWPRALVPYQRIHGVAAPVDLCAAELRTPKQYASQVPEGAPFGLVGSSSLLKRETYPAGVIRPGSVTASYAGVDKVTARFLHAVDPWENLGGVVSHGGRNWVVQGADAGRYGNEDVHAIRILVTEPQTDPKATASGHRLWWSASNERLRILGEIPVRKFVDGEQPIDSDGNPDTSFLAAVPADVPWTLQTLDRDGLVLNMAQTWHQVRPGEVRFDCGGCHGHGQPPTPWDQTLAAKTDYHLFDLTSRTPLVTTKANDQSGVRWDTEDKTGLRYAQGAVTVEYHRDIVPILTRSCVPCHSSAWKQPAAGLVLDDDSLVEIEGSSRFGRDDGPRRMPATYVRLVLDASGKFGLPPPAKGVGYRHGSRYVMEFQARRSLLVWKVFGRRLDGFDNEQFAYEAVPGDATTMQFHGAKVDAEALLRSKEGTPAIAIAYLGEAMPPPAAVDGTYVGPLGETIRVPGLSDEERRTFGRWVDLGCPIDFGGAVEAPANFRERGLLADDLRPTLSVASPMPGVNRDVDRIVVGALDYMSGLEVSSLRVVADVPIDGAAPGTDLAPLLRQTSPGVWQMDLRSPLEFEGVGKLTVSMADHAGNVARLERTFSLVHDH